MQLYLKLPHKNGSFGKWPSAQEAWDILFPTTIKLDKGLNDSK